MSEESKQKTSFKEQSTGPSPSLPYCPPVSDTILSVVGNTPLVKLQNVASHLKCNVYVKCEYFNAGGSVKDRIGLRMIEAAENTSSSIVGGLLWISIVGGLLWIW